MAEPKDAAPIPVAVLPDCRDLDLGALLTEVMRIRDNGWRLAAVTCVRCSDQGAELLYHFQRGPHRLMDMRHYRVMVPGRTMPPSLVPLFPCAFLAENEIQDQFGLAFTGLAPDLKGRLYLHGGPPPLREAPEAPKTNEPGKADSGGEAS